MRVLAERGGHLAPVLLGHALLHQRLDTVAVALPRPLEGDQRIACGTGRLACTGSENGHDGLLSDSTNALSVARYSNCVFANNGFFGVGQARSGSVETRGNNTITGNGTAPTFGVIGSFSPL
jgi:hypothetical protein